MANSKKREQLIEYFSSLGLYIPNLFNEEGIKYIKEIQTYPQIFTKKYGLKKLKQNLPIAPNNSLISSFEPHIQKCSNFLYELSQSWTLDKLIVMISGNSLPIQCTVSSLYPPSPKTFYIKNHDIETSSRAFGILLLEYHSRANRNYQCIITDKHIIENAVEGIHIELSDLQYKQDQFKLGLVEMALASMTIGLEDIEIFDSTYNEKIKNYIVNPQTGIHTPVDLEYLGSNTPDEILGLHKTVVNKLNISHKEYLTLIQSAYDFYFRNQNIQNKKKIAKILDYIPLLANNKFEESHYIAYKKYIEDLSIKKLIYKL